MKCCREGCSAGAVAEIVTQLAGHEDEAQHFHVCSQHHAETVAMALAMQRLTGMPEITEINPDDLVLMELEEGGE